MDSMSSGLMSAARLVKSNPRLLNAVDEPGRSDGKAFVLSVLLSIGRPSTIMSGWLLLLIELTPRIVIDDEAPGTPDELTTFTPATRPCSALTKFSRCVEAIAVPATDCCAVPSARSAVVCPRAVTTTASSEVIERRSATLITLSAPTARSAGVMPTKRKVSTCPGAARSEKLPAELVTVPVVVPRMTTDAPGSGALCSSVTRPVMVFCCAMSGALTRRIPVTTMRVSLFIAGCTGVCRVERRKGSPEVVRNDWGERDRGAGERR